VKTLRSFWRWLFPQDDKAFVRSMVPPDWKEVPCSSKPYTLQRPDGTTIKLVPFAAFENPDKEGRGGPSNRSSHLGHS
jgi:hypothetical protein